MNAESLRVAHAVDQACLAIAFLLPVATVLRWNIRGVLLGALINWGSLIAAGILMSEIAPGSRGADHSILDILWFLFGWVFGVAYCFLLYGMKRLVLFLIRLSIRKSTLR